MPRSKRNKIVSLTKTASKGKSLKSKMIESLRESIDQYKDLYVLSFENMRAAIFKDVRIHFRESRIYLGKNSVAQVALGKTPEDEYKDNLRNVSKCLEGNVGLFFTNREKKEVIKYFRNYHEKDYAKAGAMPDEDILLETGELPFPTQMLDQLRKLGLVVEIDDGKVMLRIPFYAAKQGEPLTPEQAKLLVHLDKKLIDFSVKLVSHWTDGKYEEF